MVKQYKSEKAEDMIIKTYDELLARWDVELKEMDVDTRYGKTHVIECGDKNNKPLILFHGVGDDSALMWLYNAKRLSEKFHIFAIDTMGGPGKSRFNEEYTKTYDDVLWIDELLDKLGLKQVFMAGVSNGGYLTQRYTASRPERVIHGIAMSAAVAYTAGKSAKGSVFKMMKIFLPEALFPTMKNTHKLIRKLCGKNYRVFTDDPTFMEHYKWLLSGFNNKAMTYHKLYPLNKDELEIVKSKINYLLGTEDPFQTEGGMKASEDAGVMISVYEGAGHGINHEFAKEVNEEIIEIFSKYN